MSVAEISSPVSYTQFPVRFTLCGAREVRGNIVSYCDTPARPGGDLCTWHDHLREYHREDGRGDLWAGLEVSYGV
jgi:hypothetical protein